MVISDAQGRSMTNDRWNEIYNAFAAVAELETADREVYLRQQFVHDADLRDQVAELLRNAHQADKNGFLKDPAWIVDDIPLFLPDFQNGSSQFSNIEYLGHGGMGVVYKAYHR